VEGSKNKPRTTWLRRCNLGRKKGNQNGASTGFREGEEERKTSRSARKKFFIRTSKRSKEKTFPVVPELARTYMKRVRENEGDGPASVQSKDLNELQERGG